MKSGNIKRKKNSPTEQKRQVNNFLEKNSFFIFAIVLLITCLVLFPVLRNGFLIYDDPENVTGNVLITSMNFQHLKLFFTSPLLYMYTPLVYISFAIDFVIADLNPVMFHFTNLLLHLLNVILVFVYIKKMTGKKDVALITSALFALHPLNAGTVAWISTRSTLLFTFFFLGALIYYFNYLNKNFKLKYYFSSLILFLLACLSKSSAVVFPVILILADYMKQRELKLKCFAEKIPFFFIAIVTGIVTLYFRNDASKTELPFSYSMTDKFFILCYSFADYFYKLFLPLNLSAVYSYPAKLGGQLPVKFYFSLLILLLLVFTFSKLKKFRKEFAFGILFFVITLYVSIMGFLEDGFVANRYVYLPYIGLFFFIGSSYNWLVEKNKVFILILPVFLIFHALLTFDRTIVWKDSITLFNDVIKKQPVNGFAYNSRGIAKNDIQDYTGAIEDYSQAIKLNPFYTTAYYNRAISFYLNQNFSQAMHDYSKALELNPASSKSYMGRGVIKMDVLKNNMDAQVDFDKAIALNPGFVQAYYNRGIARLRQNNMEGACEDFNKVKQLGYPQADELIQHNCR